MTPETGRVGLPRPGRRAPLSSPHQDNTQIDTKVRGREGNLLARHPVTRRNPFTDRAPTDRTRLSDPLYVPPP